MPTAHTLAAVPIPVRVFGQHMRPFSPGHFTLLDALDNAFVSAENRNITQADLITGVMVCSRNHQDGLSLCRDMDAMTEAAEALGAIVGAAVAIEALDYETVIAERAQLFADYVREAQKEPRYWVNETGGQSSGLGWFASMKLCLTGELGYSQADFWDAPLSQCIADYLGHMAQSGSIRMMTPQEIELVDAAKKAEAECLA